VYSVSRCLEEAKAQTESSHIQQEETEDEEQTEKQTEEDPAEMEDEAELCWRVMQISAMKLKARRREPILLRRVLVQNTLRAARAAARASYPVPPPSAVLSSPR